MTGEDVGRALIQQGQLIERMRAFQQKYEFLICAVNQVPPFDATEPWPKSIDGVAMENYVAWMKTAYWISTTCCPAISVPAGFTRRRAAGRRADRRPLSRRPERAEDRPTRSSRRPDSASDGRQRMTTCARTLDGGQAELDTIIAKQSPEMAKLTQGGARQAAAAISRRGRAGLRQEDAAWWSGSARTSAPRT